MSLRKLPRSSLKSWAIGHLRTKQGGNCAICKKPIDLRLTGVKADMVVDHCHETGLIRGVLHKSCNSSEGKGYGSPTITVFSDTRRINCCCTRLKS